MSCNSCRRQPVRTSRASGNRVSGLEDTCSRLERLGQGLPLILDTSTLEVSLDPSLGTSSLPIYSQLGVWGCTGRVALDLKHVMDFVASDPVSFRNRMMRNGSTPPPAAGKLRTNLHTLLRWC